MGHHPEASARRPWKRSLEADRETSPETSIAQSTTNSQAVATGARSEAAQTAGSVQTTNSLLIVTALAVLMVLGLSAF